VAGVLAGLPLTFWITAWHADSISGPFFTAMATLPVGGKALDSLLGQDVGVRLSEALNAALHEVRALEATVGADAADLALKAAAKRRLDVALRPLRLLAHAWSGAVMLATRDMDDEWLELARDVAATGTWPEVLTERQEAMLAAGRQALPWDLAFAEVFRPDGVEAIKGGFDAVLSNPPWDIMQPNTAEFLGGFDLAILEAPSRQEAHVIRDRLLADAAVAAWRTTKRSSGAGGSEEGFTSFKYGAWQWRGRKADLYRLFAERMLKMGKDGAAGWLSIRLPCQRGRDRHPQAVLQQTRMEQCLSFENRKSLFDIHASFKIALIVARRPGPTRIVRCGFYMTDLSQIEEQPRVMGYTRDFIDSSGGAYATFLELRGPEDLTLAKQMYVSQLGFGKWTERTAYVQSN
jgi:hypothetical protein